MNNRIFHYMGTILFCQLLAPLEALNLPSFGSLKVDSVNHRPRGLYPDDWGQFLHGHNLEKSELKETPEMLIIQGTGPKGRWTCAIDLEDNTFGYIPWYAMVGSEYKGSGINGVMLFGLPALVVTSPLWLTTNTLRGLIYLITRRDLDTWFVWLKLFTQLESKYRKIFWKAWSNELAGIKNKHNEQIAAQYAKEMEKYKHENYNL